MGAQFFCIKPIVGYIFNSALILITKHHSVEELYLFNKAQALSNS
jgi:hypothetical protein